MPPIWLWNLIIHLPGGLPMGQAGDLDTAKAEFKAAWKALEARDHTEAAGNGLQGNEHSGRRLKDGPPPLNIGGPPGHPGACGCG